MKSTWVQPGPSHKTQNLEAGAAAPLCTGTAGKWLAPHLLESGGSETPSTLPVLDPTCQPHLRTSRSGGPLL